MKEMKVVYLEVCDPIAWRKPDAVFDDDDLEYISKMSIHRVAGIVIRETDDTIVIGEVEIAEDNPKYEEFGHSFPKYRYVMTLLKNNIIERQDFEIKEKKVADNRA